MLVFAYDMERSWNISLILVKMSSNGNLVYGAEMKQCFYKAANIPDDSYANRVLNKWRNNEHYNVCAKPQNICHDD